MVEIQEDWQGRKERDRMKREDARETVARAVAYALLFRYEVWKARCKMVMEEEQPMERRRLQEEIRDLRIRDAEVSARDRNLFEERNAPRGCNSIDKMRQWTRSVKNSILRKERFDLRGQRVMRTYLDAAASNAARTRSANEKSGPETNGK